MTHDKRKPAKRGLDGLSGVVSLAARQPQKSSSIGGHGQQRRTSPADLLCAADRLERMAGRSCGDADNLLRIAGRFRRWAVAGSQVAA